MQKLGTAVGIACLFVFTDVTAAAKAKGEDVYESIELEMARKVSERDSVEEKKVAARTLATKGFDLLEEGNYERAIHFFVQADKLYHAPTIVLLLAEAHEKLNKLVEARAFYRTVVNEELPRSSPREFFDAQFTARQRIDAIDRRLATLQVIVPGARRQDVVVTVDGQRMTPYDQPHEQNPGKHMIAVSYDGGETVTQTVTLQEGAAKRVILPLSAFASDNLLVPAAVAFGVGLVGIGVGTVASLVTMNKVDDLGAGCTDGRCADPGRASTKTWATVSTVGFVAGGVGLGASAVMLYFRRRDKAGDAQTIATSVGPGSIRLFATF